MRKCKFTRKLFAVIRKYSISQENCSAFKSKYPKLNKCLAFTRKLFGFTRSRKK